jgi:hypothetical protein
MRDDDDDKTATGRVSMSPKECVDGTEEGERDLVNYERSLDVTDGRLSPPD